MPPILDASKPHTLAELSASEHVHEESPEVGRLVERAKTGDPQAFDDLMRSYERRIIAIGIHMGLSRDDAMDACQDSFVKVFRYIGCFRSGESFFRWLYRIAVNVIYDHLGRNRGRAMVSAEEIGSTRWASLRDDATPADRLLESADLVRKLLAGMDHLTRQERIVFVLRDLQEVSTGEIGKILRVSQVTVRRHCMSARQKLRGLMSERPG